jgi:5-methylcytosine-specific restriction endonuclease McrA
LKIKIESENYKAEISRLRALPYKEYLLSHHWKDVRKRALYRSQFKCQLCNKSHKLAVHHRTYERRGEEDNRDVIVLCANCHSTHHKNIDNLVMS